jgi:N-acetylmuramoyl-L-alanine amidase
MTAVNTLHPAPDDYALQRIGTDEYFVPPYAKFLEGVRIFLDPGHGGEAHKRGFKRGPTGVREAEMNLRIAKYLRDFLEHAGAEVKLSRERDVFVANADRPKMAADWEADLFISLHHNAVSRPEANFTTVWYHKTVDERPSNLDLARYLCGGLYERLALPQITDVPLKSDQLMYQSGFGVLRGARMTAALTESSFFTNPEEEQRLRDPAYNLREAHGLFLGLARYAAAGLPRAELTIPEDGVVSPGDEVVFSLDDGLRYRGAWGAERQMILRDSVELYLNDAPLDFEFVDDGETYTLTATIPENAPAGEHTLTLHFMNKMKNSNLDPVFGVVVE